MEPNRGHFSDSVSLPWHIAKIDRGHCYTEERYREITVFENDKLTMEEQYNTTEIF